MSNSIVFIGINYRTPDKTKQWVNSIYQTNPKSTIIVVDNSRNDNPDLEQSVEHAVYIDSQSNLGYFNGAAVGYKYVLEQNIDYSWIVVSNVDVEVCTQNIESILEKYTNAGIVAPSIISNDTGFDKNPYRLRRGGKKELLIKKVAFSNGFFCFLYSIVSDLRNQIIKRKHANKPKCNEGESIYLPYGACIFFSKKYFMCGGKIEFPLFLFGEELFVAEQCLKMNIPVVYVPSIKILNMEHASTSKLLTSYIRENNYKATKYILEEYY